ncbi:hypothetical protein [Costertonia aggregata]|uniref:Uncharacterized protein n=1 Tax=Costertonia aggregata TaxID=343403 RepID=A0A7H9ANT4_9FLAO|nr:hypothetical protein [Costertonia aggregata]QLG44925.1 hypothetical protein HYG79_06010 [Costertonia aggregata]
MKNRIQILTGVLAFYVLSLPVVLFFHSQSHVQGAIEIVDSDVLQIIAHDDSDCQICSFYFDKQLFVEDSVVYELNFSSYYFLQDIVEFAIVLSQEQQCPRGPPVV